MARSALLRGKFRPRRHRFTPLSAIHFAGSLSLAQPANTITLDGAEKFFEALALAAPANIAIINAASAHSPGRASIADAMQGGLLTITDQANGSVQITESV